MSSPSENKELIESAWTQAYNEGDLDIVDKTVSEDITVHDPFLPEPLEGREALKEYIMELRSGFSDLETHPIRMVADGDWVAVHFTFEGTHDGELMGIEPTGERVEGRGMEFDRIEDGHIVESWSEWDTLTFLQQVGAVDPNELPQGSGR